MPSTQLAKEPVSKEELAKAKRQKTAEYVQSLQKVDSLASMMARDLMSTGDPHFSARYVDEIQKVTAEDIQRVAGKYLQARQPGQHAGRPAGGGPGGVGAGDRDQERWASPAAIRMVKLDNGLRVLLQKNPATPTVSVQFYGLGGLLAENLQNNGITNLMAEASLRGTKTRSGEQIAEFFDSIGAGVDAGAGSNTFYYKAEVLMENLQEALPVFADVVLNPSFAPEAIEEVRKPILDRIRAIDEDWRSELFQQIRRKYFGEHPYSMDPMGQIESVSQLTGDDLRKFHDQYLAGAELHPGDLRRLRRGGGGAAGAGAVRASCRARRPRPGGTGAGRMPTPASSSSRRRGLTGRWRAWRWRTRRSASPTSRTALR